MGIELASSRFEGYQASRYVPNIVVDGAPNESTVLTLSHWPQTVQPVGLEADLSAEMAFLYIDRLASGAEPLHGLAEVVTNNHFDQDGLVGLFALVDPVAAMAHRSLLVDVAAAGDFAIYSDRRAARASMIIASFGNICDVDTSVPGAYDAFSDSAYEATLPMVYDILFDQERFEDRWRDEDSVLARCETLLAEGAIRVRELGPRDGGADSLAVVDLPDEPPGGGHRFGSDVFEWVHPMAINNRVRHCVRLLMRAGRRYRYVDRYETWVQYRSRNYPRRVDLRPIAESLTAAETGGVVWEADDPSALSPRLWHEGESSLGPDEVLGSVGLHLRTAEPAWQPFVSDQDTPSI